MYRRKPETRDTAFVNQNGDAETNFPQKGVVNNSAY